MIEHVVNNLPLDALKTALAELSDWQKTGILADGVVRQTAKGIGGDTSLALILAERAMYRRAATLWAESL